MNVLAIKVTHQFRRLNRGASFSKIQIDIFLIIADHAEFELRIPVKIAMIIIKLQLFKRPLDVYCILSVLSC